jgi:cold shock CspA family protein
MPDRRRDLRDCLTAYDCRDRLPDLAAWMAADLLKQITIWKGSRFERGEEYFDLDNPARGPFVATGDEGAPTNYTYVCRSQVAAPAWLRLITWQQPIDESQADALIRQAEFSSPLPAQSAAGEALADPGATRVARREGGGQRPRLHGVVARIVPERGFGFVSGDDGQEFFFHRTALQATAFEDLALGVTVTFEIGQDPGDRPGEDPRAVSVRLADDAFPAVDNETLPQEKTL